MGVDVFFVISGFLITGLLVKALRAGTFSFRHFWERRVRRLVPALAVTTLVTSLAGYLVLLPEHLYDLGGSAIAQPLCLSNLYFWRTVKGGYFGDSPDVHPLLHTWSLGLEEQFYIFFPCLLVLMYHWRQETRLLRWLGGLALVSFASCVILTPLKPALSFYTLPTRSWELLLGGLLAVKSSRSKATPGTAELFSWIGLMLVLGSIFLMEESASFPGYIALIPCLGTVLLIWSNESHVTRIGKLLSHGAIVRIGQISYSFYLWHWPIMAFGHYSGILQSTEAKVLSVLLSFALGYLSWRYIETPFRERHFLPAARHSLYIFLLYAVLSMSIGATLMVGKGFPHRWDPVALAYNATKHDTISLRKLDVDLKNPRPRVVGEAQGPAKFLLWGDSHARALYPALEASSLKLGVKGYLVSQSSTPPLIHGNEKIPADAWEELVVDTVSKDKIPLVFLASSWMSQRNRVRKHLSATVGKLQAAGATVVFVADVPRNKGDLPQNAALRTRYPRIADVRMTGQEHEAYNREVTEYVESASGFDPKRFLVLNPAPVVLAWPSLADGEDLLYSDLHHLSRAGALKLEPFFTDFLRDQLNLASPNPAK